jgi:putative spermidine/putrescine transport system permease protein
MKINYKESRPSLLLYIFALLAAIYLIAPILIILPLSLSSSRYLKFPPPGWSLEWYKAFFTDPVWMSSLANSFKIGIVASIVATVVGTAAAYGFVRGRIKGQKIIVAFILSPMIVPIIVTAISLYGFYALIGVVGGFWGILIGHTVFVTPLVLISVIANLQRFDPV